VTRTSIVRQRRAVETVSGLRESALRRTSDDLDVKSRPARQVGQIPGVVTVLPRHGILTLAVVIVVVLLSGASRLETTVNLEWRPHRQTVEIGEIVEIALYAVSSTALDVSVTGIQAILIWDPAYLGFQGIVDPCNGGGTCPDNAYDWLTSDFPPNVLNITFDDGNAFYVAFAHFTSGAQAVATSEGLWVTTFQFEALSPTLAELRLEMTFDEATRTRVAGGQPGTDITGELGPPAEVVIVGCLTPAALAVGCRYLSITPAPCMDPIALLVTGEIGDPAIACLSAFVQADGTLGEIPVFQMPDEWGTEGTVYVTDLTIVPSATYDVQAACGQEGVVESV